MNTIMTRKDPGNPFAVALRDGDSPRAADAHESTGRFIGHPMGRFPFFKRARLLSTLLLSGSVLIAPFIGATAATNAKEFVLEAYILGYKGVGGEIDGQVNPDLKVNQGDVVSVTLVNKENMAHDVALDGHGVASKQLLKTGEKTSLTFTATSNDTYYCTIPGHRMAGMEGKLIVAGGSEPASGHAHAKLVPASKGLKEARRVTVDEIGWNASDLPPPLERTTNQDVEFVIETEEVIAELEDGTTYELWTYDGKVPGPMLRVKEGDMVTVHVDNLPNSSMAHSIDFHSVTGPGGGAAVLQVPPGERRSLRFKALQAGLYVYHCATPHIPTHLARGMYGMILVEPLEGLTPVDREFYVMQGEYYTVARPGTKGHQLEDPDRLFEEMPTYILFNGRVGSLTGDRVMKANVGETVRLFFGVGGPNKHSAFHIIGEIFDKVYPEAAIIDPPLRNVQTTSVPPGGATVVEFKLDYPGKYLLVDHALTRLDKGAVGIIDVQGEADDSIYKSLDRIAPVDH